MSQRSARMQSSDHSSASKQPPKAQPATESSTKQSSPAESAGSQPSTPRTSASQSSAIQPSAAQRPATQSTKTQSADTPLSFGARLRRERERRRVSIASIAESTKILGALLEGLENDDVSRWPIGFYRRAFIRAYATSIGLDPEPVVREFMERFPEPEETPPAPAASTRPRRTRLRVMLAKHCSWFIGGPLLERLPPRISAAAFDIAILGAISVCLFVILDVFWAPFSVAALCYYCGAILVLGNTPGVCLYAPEQHPWSRGSSSRSRPAQGRWRSIWNRLRRENSSRIVKSVASRGWSRSGSIETAGLSK